jgi:divalent metal cation (Fe/Co/Zn/Cd) transporter
LRRYAVAPLRHILLHRAILQLSKNVNNVTFYRNNITYLHGSSFNLLKIYNENKMRKAGIIILILGLLLTIFTAFTFFTREKVAEIGSLKITANKPHHLSWSPLIGIAVMGVGGVFLLMSPKK